jgi:hypothetical protein
VEVRDDVARLVNHEAGAERLLSLLRESEGVEEGVGLDRPDAGRRDLDDTRRAPAVDVVDAQPLRLGE